MKKHLLHFFFSLIVNLAVAQTTWQKTYNLDGQDMGYSMQLTSDGGFVMTGASLPLGEGEDFVYLLRANADGDIIWTKTFGNDVGNYGEDIEQCSDSGFIVVGSITQDFTQERDLNLTKISAGGTMLWTKKFGGGIGALDSGKGFSVKQTFDNGFIVAGLINYGNPFYEILLIRTDSNGDTLWTKAYGGTIRANCGYAVQQTVDSGFIIAGSTHDIVAGNSNVYLIKTNMNGDTLWTRAYGTVDHDEEAYSVDQTTDKGFIVAGHTRNLTTYFSDVYLIRTDSSGDTLWTRSYGSSKSDVAQDVHQTNDEGFIIAGYSNSSTVDTADVYIIRTDVNGDTLWTKTYGGIKVDKAFSIHHTNDNGYLIGGYSLNFGLGSCAYVIKTDANGNSGCNELATSTIVYTPVTIRDYPQGLVGSGAFDSTAVTGIWPTGSYQNTLCSTVGIQHPVQNPEPGIKITPNPFNTSISLKGAKEKGEVILEDVTGKEILRKRIFEDETKLNTANLSNGFYLLRYFDGKTVEIFKVIKQ